MPRCRTGSEVVLEVEQVERERAVPSSNRATVSLVRIAARALAPRASKPGPVVEKSSNQPNRSVV